MILRRILRKILPLSLSRFIGRRVVARRSAMLSKYSVSDAFDQIYRRQMWRQGSSLSGLGSEGKWAEDYTSFVINFIQRTGAQKIIDAGCGDFTVGEKIAPYCREYIGLDISSEIISINRQRFGTVSGVKFGVLNLIDECVPECDLLLVRQVLQHLSNSQIEGVLRNIEAANVKYVLIAEHSIKAEKRIEANVDLGSHSVITRVSKGSGVDIGLPPFSRPRRIVAELAPGPENGAEPDSVLYIYELERG